MRINAISIRIDIEHEITFTLIVSTDFESNVLIEFLKKLENCIFKISYQTLLYFTLLTIEHFLF